LPGTNTLACGTTRVLTIGAARKGAAICDATEVTFQQKLFALMNKNVIFEHCRKFETFDSLYSYNFFNIHLSFSELPSIYTLHKNALFHLPAASVTKAKSFYEIETMSATKTW
jgi:hypothetical protein